MPFRARLKKTFSRNSRSSHSSSDTSSTLSGSSGKRASNVYQPGEKIPQKYRRPVDKAHKEKLEAFTFAFGVESCRRQRSFQSLYSPMGSRMPSRRNSIEHIKREAIGPRGGSFLGEGFDDDSDSATVAMSRQSSDGHSPRGVRDFADPPRHRGSAFTEEDLSLAMKQSHLTVPRS